MLDELDLLDVGAGGLAIQREATADHLHDVGTGALGELLGCLTAGEVGAVLDRALDELVRLEALLGLGDHAVVDVAAADVDDGLEVMGEAAKLTDLFAGKCHGGKLSFWK